MNKTTAILLAAGKSERLGKMIPKPFLKLNGKAIYKYSLDVFLAHPQIDSITVVVPQHLLLAEQNKLSTDALSKPVQFIVGGKSRFESVKNALDQLNGSIKTVLIHDAARPFVQAELINQCLKITDNHPAVSCAVESTNTLVIESSKGQAESYPDRSKIHKIQTPQAFDINLLKTAYSLAIKEGKTHFTDDSSMIHYYNLAPVFLVPGDSQNIKITHLTDLLLAELILKGSNAD